MCPVYAMCIFHVLLVSVMGFVCASSVAGVCRVCPVSRACVILFIMDVYRVFMCVYARVLCMCMCIGASMHCVCVQHE